MRLLAHLRAVRRYAFGSPVIPCKRNSLQGVAHPSMMDNMAQLQERLVVVPFGALDETLELTRLLLERLPHEDQLAIALRGAAANLRAEAVLEP